MNRIGATHRAETKNFENSNYGLIEFATNEKAGFVEQQMWSLSLNGMRIN